MKKKKTHNLHIFKHKYGLIFNNESCYIGIQLWESICKIIIIILVVLPNYNFIIYYNLYEGLHTTVM